MADKDLARALFQPRSVALIGASGDAEKNTARPLRYLRRHGFKGRVVPINRGRGEVLGEKAWPDLASAPGPIDHAYIMVPAAAVPGVIAECVGAGVKVASIYSDGFAELGADGLHFQEDLIETARQGGVRVLGPNSMGVVNVRAAFTMTTNAALEAPGLVPGPLAVVSHSGTALGALLSRGQARGFGFSKLVSIGNEADLSVGEVVDILVDDEDTGAILLFLETIRHARALARAARRAYGAGKPVIAYKLGRSDAGRRMAVSHSGALAGPDEAADAFFRHHGILRVDGLETLLEIPFLVMGRRPAAARRVAVMTTTGGGAAMVVDRLGLAGVDFAVPPMSVVERMIGLDIRIGEAPVTDLTMAGARAEVYGPTLRELLDFDGCDAVVAVVGSSAQFRPDVAVDPIIAEAKGPKPLAVFCVPEASGALASLADAGIAGFRTPESCADAVRAYLDWSAPAAPAQAAADLAPAEALLAGARAPRLDAAAALEVFGALGIARAPHWLLCGDGVPPGIAYPVAAKVLSADIPHKTEAGGVVLDIADDAGLEAAAAGIEERALNAHPGADIGGVLVQGMERGLAEALVGYRLDPETGPVVVLGAGGTLTELYEDVAVRMAPVDIETARAMIEDVRGLALIRGYRGLPEGDLDALADAVAALSRLAGIEGATVLEAEINPLVVKARGEGAVAVDGLIVLEDNR